MGLAERRIIKDFQENYLPTLERRINEAAGLVVPLELEWEKIGAQDYSHVWLENWPQLYFEPLIAALREIARDEMGRGALSTSLKKIVITDHGKVIDGSHWSSFEGGVLTLNHSLTNVGNSAGRIKGLISTLEKGL